MINALSSRYPVATKKTGRRLSHLVVACLVAAALMVISVARAQDEIERQFWESVNCDSETEVRAYLETYPDGSFHGEAQDCLRESGSAGETSSREDGDGDSSSGPANGISVQDGLEVTLLATYRRITAFNEGRRVDFGDLQISGDGSRIAFASVQGAWVANADGTGLMQLSDQRVGHGGVDISSDGGMVAWSDGQGLFVHDLVSGERRPMPAGIEVWSLRLSGDGRWLFVWDYNTGSLFRMPTDGSDLRKVMTNDLPAKLSGRDPNRNLWGKQDEGPSVSHDGNRVAFAYGGEAFVMNGDGTDLRMLTRHNADGIKYMSQVKLSADGHRVSWFLPQPDNRIVIADTQGNVLCQHAGVPHVSRVELTGDGAWVAVGNGIRLLSADGTRRTYLTHVGHNYPMAVRGAQLTSISDDGRRLAIVVDAQFGDAKGYKQVMVVDIDPDQLVDVPALREVRVVPRFLPNDGATRATLTAHASGEAIERVMAFLMKNGYQGANGEYGAIPLADDGSKYGDTDAGDGWFTTNELRLNPRGGEPVPPGPLNLRLFAVNELGNMVLMDIDGLESRAP